MHIVLTPLTLAPFSYAKLTFNEHNEPTNLDFNDVYFYDAGGFEETKHVFIAGNNLKERFSTNDYKDFVILETGFGTGSNLITLMNFTQSLAKKPKHISFLSFELMPLSKDDFFKAHKFTPFNKEAQKVINAYTVASLKSGLNIIPIDKNFTLYLIIGDIVSTIKAIDSKLSDKVDAVFLDGFAPKQNEAMWSVEVFKALHDLLTPEASLATFSVARMVREHLQACNFTLQKRPGFGRKREMLVAYPIF